MLEDEAYFTGAFDLDPIDIGVVAAVHRRAFAHQGLEGELDVFGGYRLAVMETGFGAQVETYPGVVRGFLYFRREQPVLGEGLVQAMAGQGVINQADIVGCHALVDEGVEAVEAAKARLAKGAALGGGRVDVVEVLVVGRVLRRLVIQGQCMLGSRQGQAGQAKQQDTTTV
ncbi:hypothetical protein D9M68_714620 [compost metagenome]